ncbi:MAG: hypothetical protein ER33_02845 [Cyanobium sp. CACIAM 14]|nr:MAG: hypothetical protein ER33_02845 [Cyanobium sp. CACIAM 14]
MRRETRRRRDYLTQLYGDRSAGAETAPQHPLAPTADQAQAAIGRESGWLPVLAVEPDRGPRQQQSLLRQSAHRLGPPGPGHGPLQGRQRLAAPGQRRGLAWPQRGRQGHRAGGYPVGDVQPDADAGPAAAPAPQPQPRQQARQLQGSAVHT